MLLFECRGFERKDASDVEIDRSPSEATRLREPYRCARCGEPITTKRERITVDGAHEHTFVNPAGIVYRIGCFRTAVGCECSTERTAEYAWFAGFAWALARCRRCALHLGWSFTSIPDERESFFGLVLERLVMDD